MTGGSADDQKAPRAPKLLVEQLRERFTPFAAPKQTRFNPGELSTEELVKLGLPPKPDAGRQKLAREFGATDIVTERGDDGVARIKELTNGIGGDSVLECVGTQESMMQAIQSTRPGGYVSYVGVPHGVELNGEQLFFAQVHLHGGPAPVRRYLPELIKLVLNEKINPGKVFDLTLPINQVAEGYRAMDERRAIKTLLRP